MRSNKALVLFIIALLGLLWVALEAQPPRGFEDTARVIKLPIREGKAYELRFRYNNGAASIALDSDVPLNTVLSNSELVRVTVERIR